MRVLFFILTFAILPSALAEQGSSDSTKWLLSLTANYHYTNSLADKVEGAGYSERFANPLSAELAIGYLAEPVYVGVAYDYWLTRRRFTLGGIETTDTLRYHSIGAEMGYMSKNPRVFFLAVGGLFYPIERRVTGADGSIYSASDFRVTYRVRGQVGVRFNRTFALLFGGGYRWNQLGSLEAGVASFLPGGASLDMTGPFLDAGLGFAF